MGHLGPGDNANGPLASEVWVQPLEQRQIEDRRSGEMLDVHTGMKNL